MKPNEDPQALREAADQLEKREAELDRKLRERELEKRQAKVDRFRASRPWLSELGPTELEALAAAGRSDRDGLPTGFDLEDALSLVPWAADGAPKSHSEAGQFASAELENRRTVRLAADGGVRARQVDVPFVGPVDREVLLAGGAIVAAWFLTGGSSSPSRETRSSKPDLDPRAFDGWREFSAAALEVGLSLEEASELWQG